MKFETKKRWFALWITILGLVGVIISWNLANRFADIADLKYIEIIITAAIFLAGFGLLALDKKDSVFVVNVKQIISWSMLSIISAFCYIIFPSGDLGKMFFALSSGFLFFTMTLVFILVIYHDSKYLKDIEKKR